MQKFLLAASVGVAIAVALALPRTLSTAQEAQPPQITPLLATIDITPIQTEIQALKAEVTALRQAVTDPKGLRAEVAQASESVKAMDERLQEIAALIKAQTEGLKPVVAALDPNTTWEYQCLRSRSESVANRLAAEGWQLVTASQDWLFFKRPARQGGDRRKE